MESLIQNGALLNGNTVLHSEMVGGRCLVLTANEHEYVSAWLPPKTLGIRWEWLWGNYRQSGVTALERYMTRYGDAGGTEYDRVRKEVREALSAWQKERS